MPACSVLLICAGGVASAQEHVITPEMLEPAAIYSPFVNRDYPDQVLFGDTHFHTELSFDAGMIGTRLDVDDAYRFARGEKTISNTGQPVQLIRPLDFLFITDHAEFIGLAPADQDFRAGALRMHSDCRRGAASRPSGTDRSQLHEIVGIEPNRRG